MAEPCQYGNPFVMTTSDADVSLVYPSDIPIMTGLLTGSTQEVHVSVHPTRTSFVPKASNEISWIR
jgi:hypothetical protein